MSRSEKKGNGGKMRVNALTATVREEIHSHTLKPHGSSTGHSFIHLTKYLVDAGVTKLGG